MDPTTKATLARLEQQWSNPSSPWRRRSLVILDDSRKVDQVLDSKTMYPDYWLRSASVGDDATLSLDPNSIQLESLPDSYLDLVVWALDPDSIRFKSVVTSKWVISKVVNLLRTKMRSRSTSKVVLHPGTLVLRDLQRALGEESIVYDDILTVEMLNKALDDDIQVTIERDQIIKFSLTSPTDDDNTETLVSTLPSLADAAVPFELPRSLLGKIENETRKLRTESSPGTFQSLAVECRFELPKSLTLLIGVMLAGGHKQRHYLAKRLLAKRDMMSKTTSPSSNSQRTALIDELAKLYESLHGSTSEPTQPCNIDEFKSCLLRFGVVKTESEFNDMTDVSLFDGLWKSLNKSGLTSVHRVYRVSESIDELATAKVDGFDVNVNGSSSSPSTRLNVLEIGFNGSNIPDSLPDPLMYYQRRTIVPTTTSDSVSKKYAMRMNSLDDSKCLIMHIDRRLPVGSSGEVMTLDEDSYRGFDKDHVSYVRATTRVNVPVWIEMVKSSAEATTTIATSTGATSSKRLYTLNVVTVEGSSDGDGTPSCCYFSNDAVWYRYDGITPVKRVPWRHVLEVSSTLASTFVWELV